MQKDNNKIAFFLLVEAGLWENTRVSGERLIVKDSSLTFPEPVDWKEIYHLASDQSVLGLVLAGIDRLPNNQRPPKVKLLQWIGEIQMLEQQNREMNAFIGVLVDSMRKEGIYALLLKGQGVAQCYERPLWRSCGDVDLCLSKENYQKAKEFLISLASSVDPEGVYGNHQGMTINSWIVELHGSSRCGLSSRMDRILDELHGEAFCRGDVRFWNNGSIDVFLPRIDCDVLFVFTHSIKHFYKGGLGLRQICDWSRLLWTYRENINVALLEKRLRAMGLLTEWKAFGAFAVEYLGMPSDAMPLYSPETKWKRKADRICSFVMEVGNMGHNRDSSYFSKYPYVIRKVMSLGRRCGDLIHHARIFPMDSIRFFPKIVINGLNAALKGEG